MAWVVQQTARHSLMLPQQTAQADEGRVRQGYVPLLLYAYHKLSRQLHTGHTATGQAKSSPHDSPDRHVQCCCICMQKAR